MTDTMRTPERWITYDTSGFSTFPWRLGSVVAPIPLKEKICCEMHWERHDRANTRLVALELVGAQGTLKYLAHHLRNADNNVTLVSNNAGSTYTRWASGGLVSFIKRLPSGPSHIVMLHPQALPERLNPERSVYAISRKNDDLDQAYRILNAALPVPMLPTWTPWLLDCGRERKLVFDLEADGLWAIEIVPVVDAWATIVRYGIQSGALQ